jgi:hypothetical protein
MRSFTTRTAGLVILALGAWGGIVPFIGHYFHFALGPDKAWTWTSGRFYLSVLPAIAAILGGLMLIGAGPRPHARLGALLGLAAGIWFAIGPEISQLWTTGGAQGAGHGSAHIQMLEMLAYHTGLGVLMTGLAGYALPRFPLRVVEAAAAGSAATAPVGRRRRGIFGRRRAAASAATAPAYVDEPAAAPAAATGAPAATGATSESAAPAATGATAESTAPAAADTTATGRSPQYAGGHPPAVRRRRGGLLSVFSRR